jgi:LPXTG-motif cell wall-anchored protein
MKARLATALVVVLLLLVPAGALAAEAETAANLAEICYVDPTNPACFPVVPPVVPPVDPPPVEPPPLEPPPLEPPPVDVAPIVVEEPPVVVEEPPAVEPVVVVARPEVDEPEVLGVTLQQPALPVTGSNMGIIALIAAVLLTAGATALGVTRRRTRGPAQG